MNNAPANDLSHSGKSDLYITIGLIATVIFFTATGVVTYNNIQTIRTNNASVVHTHEVITNLDNLTSALKDAETGQRGYLLTGQEAYLTPYQDALPQIERRIAGLKKLTADNNNQKTRIDAAEGYVETKLEELANTVITRREKGFDAAMEVVFTDRGKTAMDNLRNITADMREEERGLREARLKETETSYGRAITSGIATAMLGVFLALIIAALMRRASILRQSQDWLKTGQVHLSNAIAGELQLKQLSENILSFLSDYFGAQAAVLYTKDGDIFRRVSTYGIPAASDTPEHFTAGDSLLGQAVKDSRHFVVKDIPDGYLSVGSALGHSKPRNLLISTAGSDGIVNTVIEFGFINSVEQRHLDLLAQLSENIGAAIKAAHYRAHLQNLLEETQRQAEELQAQAEELRVSNEELEEQSRALRESQTRLELQQAELEQTNVQLEEQTQQLESQKDDLEQNRRDLEQKAKEVERASQYKSDFLANMSHELRTPLNSALILAKLLADNPDNNLTEDQVKYAQTIQSSGNDLLALINDVLDLSKIEAGHMEVHAEILPLKRLADDMVRVFKPIADGKNLPFNIHIAPDCPVTVETDRQRIEQIIKNLLSNAFKFTEKGQVALNISMAPNGQIAIAVKDTGIGISDEDQKEVFDAFRQADGTISRKYGGTGLGLSISRELARLLGAKLDLTSTLGEGSTFTLTIPAIYDAKNIEQKPTITHHSDSTLPTTTAKEPKRATRPVASLSQIVDDRETLDSNSRIILIVEDDPNFAKILYDLIHEQDLQCIATDTAEEALILAKQYMPSAIILDVGLPDSSGLTVLDRLKRDARTRHIPIHVISASDYEETALSLGAIGYMLKPVQREQLVSVLKSLETQLEKRMRNVLIVEDDHVQRDSMQKLLGSQDVGTIAVGSASECLERLKHENFDCMVLDLSLPDASGYSLLETLSQKDAYSFPPVIVYTGRDLSAEEERKLRKYSKSIIIKGAKSPERLLDEVTLFLHQIVSELPPDQQQMLQKARNRDSILENRTILVVEDDIRNVYSLTNILEPRGAKVEIARHGKEALERLERAANSKDEKIDLVLMDVMMPEMDGLTAVREIRKNPEWKKLPVIMLTAKAMRDDQERCLDAGANDYMAKPLDVEKLLSLVRVWMPR